MEFRRVEWLEEKFSKLCSASCRHFHVAPSSTSDFGKHMFFCRIHCIIERICAISSEAARISAKDVLPFSFVRPGTGSRPRFLVTCWRLVCSTSSPPFASTSPAGPAAKCFSEKPGLPLWGWAPDLRRRGGLRGASRGLRASSRGGLGRGGEGSKGLKGGLKGLRGLQGGLKGGFKGGFKGT